MNDTMNTTPTNADGVAGHAVVSRIRWLAERIKLLDREKEVLRLQDEIARDRRTLPWVRVDKAYVFETPEGPQSLAELFDGRSQLLVQHFMFGPGWEQGCANCSYMADHSDGMTAHLAQRDISFVAISRAPLAAIERFRQRMGWRFRWVSSHGSDFNHDFHVSFAPEQRSGGEVYYNYAMRAFPKEEAPGVSAFVRDDAGTVYHTYSTYGRGVEVMMGSYRMMDLTARGRDEDALPYTTAWVRHHDRYEPRPVPRPAASGVTA